MKNECKKLIEKSLQFQGHYGNELSNHLPMAIQALDFFEADIEDIAKFYENYKTRLIKKNISKKEVSERNWKSFLGKKDFTNYFDFYKEQLSEHGIEKTLKKYLPELMVGVGASAFHPLIRLSYAIENNLLDEIAEALSLWSSHFLNLDKSIVNDEKTISLTKAIEVLNSEIYFHGLKFEGPNITSRLGGILKDEEFLKIVGSINLSSITINELSKITLKMYLSSKNNFTALHALTSSHALRVVSHYLNNIDVSYHYYVIVLLAMYVDFGVPNINIEFNTEKCLELNEVKKNINLKMDPHTIKLCYSCVKEYEFYGRSLYLLAATHRLRGES